ncbi:MAG: response regulator [Deltaproteobacteria bacterium]|nr:response regulator [Deltaproteobacteria bacterium]
MQVQVAQEPSTLTSTDLQSLHVLVVDDEPMICESLKLYLERLGIGSVEKACSGIGAIEEMGKNGYDYVFVDLMMPEMTGMELLQRIREHQQPTSVILMTGYPSMEIVIDALRNGASDFLIKPFRFEDVKISLERIQRLHHLMEKNWLLHQELEKKKEVEELNNQLEKRIRLQTTLYSIVDSLSKINRSENLYDYIINKALESCSAGKACFLIYDQRNSHLLALAHEGMEDIYPGIQAPFRITPAGERVLDEGFIRAAFDPSIDNGLPLAKTCRFPQLIATPFNIRNEPFGVLLIGNKTGGRNFDREDEFILKFLSEKAALNIENIALYDNLKQSLIATLMSLVSAIEAKDAYTQQHSTRVTEYALRIAGSMGCSHEDQRRIESSGPLHDIGKIGISDNILNKPGRLTPEEFDHIKTHPLIGVNIVTPLGLEDEELAIIRNHHERWDGKGYPDGLRGEDIPRLARILAVADAYDAMSSSRAYRKALPFPVCLRELRDKRGTQFDPEAVDAALGVLGD